eukprot:scaffold11884_cov106-Isochrysis_galbana.AAC.3
MGKRAKVASGAAERRKRERSCRGVSERGGARCVPRPASLSSKGRVSVSQRAHSPLTYLHLGPHADAYKHDSRLRVAASSGAFIKSLRRKLQVSLASVYNFYLNYLSVCAHTTR